MFINTARYAWMNKFNWGEVKYCIIDGYAYKTSSWTAEKLQSNGSFITNASKPTHSTITKTKRRT